MRNIGKALRKAYYSALTTKVIYDGAFIPVVDGFLNAEKLSTHHIIIDNFTGNADNTQQYFGDLVVITLQIVSYTNNSYTRDIVDDIEDQILKILFPDLINTPLQMPGFTILNVYKTGEGNYIDETGSNGNICRKILRIQQNIVQQS